MKKVFIISSVFLGVTVLFWLLYVFVIQENMKKSTSEEEISIQEIQEKNNENNQSDTSRFEVFADFPVLSPTLSSDGSRLYTYHKETATLYEIDTETKSKKVLQDTNLTGPIISLWSSNPEISILKTTPQQNAQYFLIDTKSQTTTALPSDITYLSWDSLSERIVYIQRKKPEEILFSTAKPDGTDTKELSAISEKGRVSLTPVPGSPIIAYWPQSANTKISPLTHINLSTKEKTEIFAGKYGADYLYAPNGERILLSWSTEKGGSKMTLATLNKYGGQYKDLGIPTLASKCVWNKTATTVYCAVPTGMTQTTVMPDDYINGKFLTVDSFWKVDIESGKKERVVELSDIQERFDATNLFIDSSEQYLFFVNKNTSTLYRITLP